MTPFPLHPGQWASSAAPCRAQAAYRAGAAEIPTFASEPQQPPCYSLHTMQLHRDDETRLKVLLQVGSLTWYGGLTAVNIFTKGADKLFAPPIAKKTVMLKRCAGGWLASNLTLPEAVYRLWNSERLVWALRHHALGRLARHPPQSSHKLRIRLRRCTGHFPARSRG